MRDDTFVSDLYSALRVLVLTVASRAGHPRVSIKNAAPPSGLNIDSNYVD